MLEGCPAASPPDPCSAQPRHPACLGRAVAGAGLAAAVASSAFGQGPRSKCGDAFHYRWAQKTDVGLAQQLPARIAEALQADLSHNEFGQWSSVEVQHTVTWALKDLARRLRVLRFDMGKTFELTDEWAGKIGLPVRPPEQASEEGGLEGS